MNVKIPQVVRTGLLLFLLMIMIAGCGGDDFSPPVPIKATLVSISITPPNPSIAPGTTVQFTARGTFSDGTSQTLTASATWTSSNTAIDISNAAGSKGLATASLAAGGTIITATHSGIEGTTELTVSPVASLVVTPASPPGIAPGTTVQFVATGTLADGTVQTLTTWATWTSSNTAVATVSDAPGSKGLTAAVAPGSSTITAAYAGASGTATLTSSALSSIVVTPSPVSIAKGTTQQFTATGTLANGNTQTLTTVATWSTSSAGVATISNATSSKGRATAVDVGTASITSSFTSVTSGPAELTVIPAVLTSLTVTPASPSIALGKTLHFIATGTFSDNSTQDLTSSVTWNSSATAIALISNATGSNGLATSRGIGTTTIKATSGTISASTTLTVTPVVLESILVTPASATIFTGFFQQFSATGVFTDGSTQNLTTAVVWQSSDTTIAVISNTAGSQGIASALLKVGSTNITAILSGITSNAAVLTVN